MHFNRAQILTKTTSSALVENASTGLAAPPLNSAISVLAAAPPQDKPAIASPVIKEPFDKNKYRFPPDNRDLLTRADNTLLRMTGRLARDWQDLTGDSHAQTIQRARQAKLIFDVVPLLFAPGLLCLGAMLIVSHINDLADPIRLTTPLAEEELFIAKGRSAHTGRINRFAILSIYSSLFLTTLMPAITDHSWTHFGLAMQFFTFQITAFEYYLQFADVPRPPPRTLPRRVLDKINSFRARPVPCPA